MPSSLIGKTGDCWRLRYGAVTMLKCLRTALRPSFLWIAGLCFPSIHLSLLGLRSVLELLERYTNVAILDPIVGLPIPLPWAPSSILSNDSEFVKFTGVVSVFAIVLPLACRLSVALARVADERDWKEAAGARRTPRLPVALTLSRGLMVETFGLWVCLQCLLFGCFGLV
ncbi:MAG: hypothetical protein EPO68_07140, partial [Planctomycetota bacterium]